MYFKGWYLVDGDRYLSGNPTSLRGPLKEAPYLPRCLAPPVYCYMDFGNTTRIRRGEPAYKFGRFGKYFPPEMSENSVSDVFKVDIWCLGNAMNWLLSRVCQNIIYLIASQALRLTQD
jgi:hypothetical protein